MALSQSDEIPREISFEEAYAAIHSWYRQHVGQLRSRTGPWAHASIALIGHLPNPKDATRVEQKAIFAEVISGLLEWAYHESDGRFKMAAYAHGALRAAGETYNLSNDDIGELRRTSLWPYLTIARRTEGDADESTDEPNNNESRESDEDVSDDTTNKVAEKRHHQRFAEAIEELIAQGRYSNTIRHVLRGLVRVAADANLPLWRAWLYPRSLLLSFLKFGAENNPRTALAPTATTHMHLADSAIFQALRKALEQSTVTARAATPLFRVSADVIAVLNEADRLATDTAADTICASRHLLAALLLHQPKPGKRVTYLQELMGDFSMQPLVAALVEHVHDQHASDDQAVWSVAIDQLRHLAVSFDSGRQMEPEKASGDRARPTAPGLPGMFRYGGRLAFDREASLAAHSLRVREYAQVIASLLSVTSGEFCFALFGRWGRGKTFLMKEVAALLPSDERAVFFSAWKYPTQPEVWIHLYETFARAAWQRAPLRRFWPLLRTGVARYGWAPLWGAYGGMLVAVMPRYWIGLGAIKTLNYLQALAGLLGILFLVGFVRTVLKTKKHLSQRYLTETHHTEKLGLQATIGDDLRWLLKGWVRPAQFQCWHFGLFGLATFLIAWLVRVQFLDQWFLGILVPILIAGMGIGTAIWGRQDIVNSPKQILLVIDDLDRCKPEHLLSVVESIKLLIEDEAISARVKVTMLIEEDILKHAIYGKYGHLVDGQAGASLRTDFTPDRIIRENSEKLFSVHLRLPPLGPDDVNDLVDKFAPSGSEESTTPTRAADEGHDIQDIPQNDTTLEERSQVPEILSEDDQRSDRQKTTADSAPPMQRSERDADVVLGLDEIREIKLALASADADFQRSIGPRTVRAFMFRYQLARLILDELNIEEWDPATLATLLLSEISRAASVQERDEDGRSAATTALRKVVAQVA